MIGTKAKNINDITNNGNIIFFKSEVSIIEIKIIIANAINVKIKCFEKKKQQSLFNLSPANDEVDEKEKNNPRENKIMNETKIFLSIFLQ